MPHSLRAYAKHRASKGLAGDPSKVSQAVAAGRLVKCVVRASNGDPKISDFALADEEWERNTDAQRRVNAAGGVDPNAGVMAPDDHGPAPRDAWGAPDPREPRAAAPESQATATERLKTAQANLAELEFKQAAGELVLAAAVRSEWANVLSQARTKLLGIPTRFRQEVPETSPSAVTKLEDLVREALEELVAAEGA